MKHYLILYCATFAIMFLLDMLWLGFIARDFYRTHMGDLLEFHLVPAVLFYLLYVAGIVIFVNGSGSDAWQSILLYGALFGLVAYGTYDLTNLSTLRGWSSTLVVVDMAWGAFDTAMAATGGWLIARFFNS